jgi:hypothetical protein
LVIFEFFVKGLFVLDILYLAKSKPTAAQKKHKKLSNISLDA